jgi:hypothetical protein
MVRISHSKLEVAMRAMISNVALLAALAAAVEGAASGPPATNPDSTARALANQVRVAIVATGDVGQYAGMCDAAGGTDSLTGTLNLQGLNDDGSAFYAGKLTRNTEVDACGTQPAPTEDQVTMCVGHLSGRAPMDVTLEVYEDDRGAWVKSKPAVPQPSDNVRKAISGCPEAGDWLSAYPNDGWMSGLGLEDVPSGRLARGTYTTENLTLEVF